MTPDPAAVPDGWQVVRLGDVADVRSGVGFPLERQGRRSGTYLFIKVSDMNLGGNETYIRTANNFVDEADVRELGATVFVPGTVVFPKVGAAIATNKKRALTVPTIIDNNIVGITVSDAKRCDARFLHAWFESVSLEQFANVSAVPSITGARLKKEAIVLPPLAEQRPIAAVLDAIDEAIERTEEVIAATERLRDALLHELLTSGVPGRHSEWADVPGLGTVPACWDLGPLNDVLTLDQPGAWGEDPTPDDPGVRVLRAADLTRDGRVDPETAAWRRLSDRDIKRRLMSDGDLMLERSGGGPGTPVGRVALIEGLGPVYCNNFCQQLRVDSDRCLPGYALRALWYRYLRGVTARLEHQTTGIRNLDYAAYLALPLPLPSLDEQAAIVEALDGVEARIERAREERARLESLQTSAADALLTGRVRVTV